LKQKTKGKDEKVEEAEQNEDLEVQKEEIIQSIKNRKNKRMSSNQK